MMEYILQTNQVTKQIGKKALVHDIDIHVRKGEIYGFLGPNGAGKTTMMKMITNLWKPTSGSIELFGKPLTPKSYEILKRMGSIIEFPTFYDHMTGRENLLLHSRYMGFSTPGSIERALELLDMKDAADRPVKGYSLGMKERLGIVRAILCDPELLILDEPTNGLDPAGMKQIRQLLKKLCAQQGITIVISSHILSEIENIADTVGILHHGRMLKEISMKDIEAANQNYIELAATDNQKALAVLSKVMGLTGLMAGPDGKIRIYGPEITPQDVARALVFHDVDIVAIGKHTETLEDYFLKLTGEEKNDDRAA